MAANAGWLPARRSICRARVERMERRKLALRIPSDGMKCRQRPTVLRERLKAMDTDGVDYSVLYPTIGGMAGERFGRLDDIELETACVQAYNDWLIEEWASASPRFVPQCIVPIWPMERTVAEIRRAVGMGHKGVIYPASPMELKKVPHINEPVYDPLWSVCQELGVPLCFHSGASPKIQMRADDEFLAGHRARV